MTALITLGVISLLVIGAFALSAYDYFVARKRIKKLEAEIRQSQKEADKLIKK